MTVQSIIDEYDLEIDDVRWYLAELMGQKFFSYKEQPEELTRYIWSGELSSSLHDMEERFVADLQDQMNRGISDETMIREIIKEILTAKRKRKR